MAACTSINTSKAEKVIGVKAVVTGKRDTPRDSKGRPGIFGIIPHTRDHILLPIDKVRYVGEEVAAVGAIDEDTAEEACDLVKVEYEELPGVFDPEEAMQDGAPKVHDYVKNNISVEYHWNFGDANQLTTSDPIINYTYEETGSFTVTLWVEDKETPPTASDSTQLIVVVGLVLDYFNWTPFLYAIFGTIPMLFYNTNGSFTLQHKLSFFC
jgi:hypothetical protein